MPVYLHLRVRVSQEDLERFNRFLELAKPYYEQPGGIRVRLLRHGNDPCRFVELIEYATEEDYRKDQLRVEGDETRRRLLREWRELLDGAPEIEVWKESSMPGDEPGNNQN